MPITQYTQTRDVCWQIIHHILTTKGNVGVDDKAYCEIIDAVEAEEVNTAFFLGPYRPRKVRIIGSDILVDVEPPQAVTGNPTPYTSNEHEEAARAKGVMCCIVETLGTLVVTSSMKQDTYLYNVGAWQATPVPHGCPFTWTTHGPLMVIVPSTHPFGGPVSSGSVLVKGGGFASQAPTCPPAMAGSYVESGSAPPPPPVAATNICKECGVLNEWAPPVPGYVCALCKGRKQLLWG